ELAMDTIDPAYYAAADGDGHTKAAREAVVDVGGDPRPAAECRASLLHAIESDPRQARLRRIRRGTVPAILRGQRPAGGGARGLLPVAADRVLRRSGRGARDRMACGRLVCAARVSRAGVAGGAAGPFDDLAQASPDRSRKPTRPCSRGSCSDCPT